jgi:hypothetical protein
MADSNISEQTGASIFMIKVSNQVAQTVGTVGVTFISTQSARNNQQKT